MTSPASNNYKRIETELGDIEHSLRAHIKENASFVFMKPDRKVGFVDQKTTESGKVLREATSKSSNKSINAKKGVKSDKNIGPQILLDKGKTVTNSTRSLADINRLFQVLIEDLEESKDLLDDNQKGTCQKKLDEIKHLSEDVRRGLKNIEKVFGKVRKPTI